MDVKTLATELSVTGQVTVADVATIATAGFRSVICNRPDREAAGQPDFAEIAAAARQAGLQAACLPVVSGQVGPEEAAAFGRLLDTLPKPILAYCRSGARSEALWSLSGRGESSR